MQVDRLGLNLRDRWTGILVWHLEWKSTCGAESTSWLPRTSAGRAGGPPEQLRIGSLQRHFDDGGTKRFGFHRIGDHSPCIFLLPVAHPASAHPFPKTFSIPWALFRYGLHRLRSLFSQLGSAVAPNQGAAETGKACQRFPSVYASHPGKGTSRTPAGALLPPKNLRKT